MRRFKNCIFHIGLPKTGTWSIQTYIRKNRDKIRGNGIVPLHPTVYFLGCFTEDCEGLGKVTENDIGENAFAKKAEKERENLINETSNLSGETLLISLEHMTERTEYIDIKKFHSFLYELAENVILVVYIRNPVHHAVSYIQAQIKSRTANCLDDAARLRLRIKPKIQEFARVFGYENMEIRKFDKNTLCGGDVVNDFINLCGIDDGVGSYEYNVNTSISLEAALIACALNKYMVQRGFNKETGSRRLKRRILESIPGDRFGLPADVLRRISEDAHDDIEWMADNIGLDFRGDPEPQPVEQATWSDDTIDAVGRHFNDLAYLHLKKQKMQKEKQLLKDIAETPPDSLIKLGHNYIKNQNVTALVYCLNLLLTTQNKEKAIQLAQDAREKIGENENINFFIDGR